MLSVDATNWLRNVRRPLVRITGFLGQRLLPRSRQVVFVSAHSDDPDALVILEYLARHTRRPLVWLGLEQKPNTALLDAPARSQVTARRLRDLPGGWALLRSALVFHTYGVYGFRRASRRQAFVNVWHGDGPKMMRPDPVATTFMVTGVHAFGLRRMEVLGLSSERLLSTGRPRADDIHRGMTQQEFAEAASRLGLDDRPIVWWLPTWREGSTGAMRLDGVTELFASIAFASERDRYQFVVKPHPNNPPQAWPPPWRVISSAQLSKLDVRWYRMLGSAAAIITDYSSVWSDFLDTSVPIAFVAPDVEDYAKQRGFYMDNWRDLLPGPLLQDEQALGAFLAGLDIDDHDSRRDAVRSALVSNNGPGATERLLSALSNRGVNWQ